MVKVVLVGNLTRVAKAKKINWRTAKRRSNTYTHVYKINKVGQRVFVGYVIGVTEE